MRWRWSPTSRGAPTWSASLDAALARFGRIDVWVNNAGRGITRPVSELTDDDLDEMMLVNVKSALYGMQAVLPHFKERGARPHHQRLVDARARAVRAVRSAYSAAKHALNALTANLRMELREHSGHPRLDRVARAWSRPSSA